MGREKVGCTLMTWARAVSEEWLWGQKSGYSGQRSEWEVKNVHTGVINRLSEHSYEEEKLKSTKGCFPFKDGKT